MTERLPLDTKEADQHVERRWASETPHPEIRDFGCILTLSNISNFEKAIAALDLQQNSRLTHLLVTHSLCSGAEARVHRILAERARDGLTTQVATSSNSRLLIQQWLTTQSPTSVVILQDDRDVPCDDRVRQQSAAIKDSLNSWCLGQASVNGIPRAALYPSEYIHRSPDLLKSRGEEFFRSNLCLHANTLASALRTSSPSTPEAFVTSILSELDPAHLVELPIVVSRTQFTALSTRVRISARIAMLRRLTLGAPRRVKREIRRRFTL
jgi:hypothetical protein